jgi:dTDP-4-dehydrorhamnose reductase
MSNIFKQAAQLKMRFPSVRGFLIAEQLFDLPLTSKNGFDLDTVAKDVNKLLKEQAEESFVSTTENPQATTYQLMLDIVKEIIADKLAEAAAARARSANAAERQRLLALLDEKNNDELKDLSKEELQKRINELS